MSQIFENYKYPTMAWIADTTSQYQLRVLLDKRNFGIGFNSRTVSVLIFLKINIYEKKEV
jgi:hypothetical protein